MSTTSTRARCQSIIKAIFFDSKIGFLFDTKIGFLNPKIGFSYNFFLIQRLIFFFVQGCV